MSHRRPSWKLEFVAESRPVSQGRIIVVLLLTKRAVPRQIKPEILKLKIRRGQNNFSISFIFVRFEENRYYRVVSVGLPNFYCRSYSFGRSRRMQGLSTPDEVSLLSRHLSKNSLAHSEVPIPP